MATAAEPLTTVEQFARRPDSGAPEELVRGRVIRMPPPKPRHGEVCANSVSIVRDYVKAHDLGCVLSNDSGVITHRGPDTVRGADVAFYSYERAPKGPLPDAYLDVPPDLVVEVRSPDERWKAVFEKVTEYLEIGVRAVVVLDPEAETAHVFRADAAPERLERDGELTVPEVLGDGFRVAVRRFFD